MALFPTKTRPLQEGNGEGCALYSAQAIDQLTVRVLLPEAPKVLGSEFVNWYVGFGDPEVQGLHVEAGISFSLRRGWNAFFNPERRPSAIFNRSPGPSIDAGEREVELTLIRRPVGGRVKFFVRMKGGVSIDLTPDDPVIRPQASRVKVVSAASDVHTCSYGEVVMTVLDPDWYRPLPFIYRARGKKILHGPERVRVLDTDPGGTGFRTELPQL